MCSRQCFCAQHHNNWFPSVDFDVLPDNWLTQAEIRPESSMCQPACGERVQLDSLYAISPVCAQHLKEVICQPALQFAPTLCVCSWWRKNFCRNYWAQSLIYFSVPRERILQARAKSEKSDAVCVAAAKVFSTPPPTNWCKHADDELMLVPLNVITWKLLLYSRL
jgi:hypothetical protein